MSQPEIVYPSSIGPADIVCLVVLDGTAEVIPASHRRDPDREVYAGRFDAVGQPYIGTALRLGYALTVGMCRTLVAWEKRLHSPT